ncbi:MAG: galactokinase [Anaerolineaceae bacterium]
MKRIGNPKTYEDVKTFLSLCESLYGTLFEAGKPILINRTPGRLDLMGGNDDYTGGLVFETTIREATIFAAQPRDDQHFVLINPSVRSMGWQEKIEFDLADFSNAAGVRPVEEVREWINRDPRQNWFATLVGNLYFLKKEHPQTVTHGLNMLLDSTIPLGKGVSSSAALEVSGMKACAAAYGIATEGVELAVQTQWVENAIAQSASGVMDQFAVVMGDEDSFTPMLCQPCIPYELVRLPAGLKIWGLDSGVRHSVAGIEYEAARAATFMGYQMICEYENLAVDRDDTGILARYTDPRWGGYLARLSPSIFRTLYEDRLPSMITGVNFLQTHPVHFDPYTPVRPEVDYPVRAAVRYAVEENQRVKLFFNIIRLSPSPLEDSTLHLLGELMYGAHAGYTDCGLGSAETNMIVDLAKRENGNDLFGAKITGGGAGGTVAILGRNTPKAEEALRRIAKRYHARSAIEPYMFEGSSQGADAFGILKQ